MRKLQKLAALGLAGSMALSLAACGGSAASSSEAAADSTPVSGEATAESTASGDETVTLNWALWDKDSTAYWQALADGYTVLIDGTNASDDAGDRPGMRALGELSVRSPLRECGITKAQVRALSQGAGLFTWDKPAYACLATRVPTGRKHFRHWEKRSACHTC